MQSLHYLMQLHYSTLTFEQVLHILINMAYGSLDVINHDFTHTRPSLTLFVLMHKWGVLSNMMRQSLVLLQVEMKLRIDKFTWMIFGCLVCLLQKY